MNDSTCIADEPAPALASFVVDLYSDPAHPGRFISDDDFTDEEAEAFFYV